MKCQIILTRINTNQQVFLKTTDFTEHQVDCSGYQLTGQSGCHSTHNLGEEESSSSTGLKITQLMTLTILMEDGNQPVQAILM